MTTTAGQLAKMLAQLDPTTEVRVVTAPAFNQSKIIDVVCPDETPSGLVYIAVGESTPLPAETRKALEW